MADKTTLDWIVWILVFVGGLNWGLVGAFNFNLVDIVFGFVSWLPRLLYILVGLSALWMLKGLKS